MNKTNYSTLLLLPLLALGCDKQQTPDKVWDEVQRYSCYGKAGDNAAQSLHDLCPVAGTKAERAVQLAACEALPVILSNLELALVACDQ